MICKNCNTEFIPSQPDENGIFTCPECGTRYRKVAPRPAEPAPAQKSASKSFLTEKIGGKVPVWTVLLAAVVVIASSLLIALLPGSSSVAEAKGSNVSARGLSVNGLSANGTSASSVSPSGISASAALASGSPASASADSFAASPKDIVRIMQAVANGEEQSLYNIIMPDLLGYFGGSRDEIEQNLRNELTAWLNGTGAEIEYEGYTKESIRDWRDSFAEIGVSLDNVQELGFVSYNITMKDGRGNERYERAHDMICKIDGKWYITCSD